MSIDERLDEKDKLNDLINSGKIIFLFNQKIQLFLQNKFFKLTK